MLLLISPAPRGAWPPENSIMRGLLQTPMCSKSGVEHLAPVPSTHAVDTTPLGNVKLAVQFGSSGRPP